MNSHRSDKSVASDFPNIVSDWRESWSLPTYKPRVHVSTSQALPCYQLHVTVMRDDVRWWRDDARRHLPAFATLACLCIVCRLTPAVNDRCGEIREPAPRSMQIIIHYAATLTMDLIISSLEVERFASRAGVTGFAARQWWTDARQNLPLQWLPGVVGSGDRTPRLGEILTLTCSFRLKVETSKSKQVGPWDTLGLSSKETNTQTHKPTDCNRSLEGVRASLANTIHLWPSCICLQPAKTNHSRRVNSGHCRSFRAWRHSVKQWPRVEHYIHSNVYLKMVKLFVFDVICLSLQWSDLCPSDF